MAEALTDAMLGYTKASVSSVSSALDKYFSELGENAAVLRAGGANVLLPASSGAIVSEFEPLIEAFSIFHPARFFTLVVDNTMQQVGAFVSARCRLVSKNEHACTEAVRFNFPESLWGAIPSAVQAHLLTGASTELFLHDASVSGPVIDLLLPFSDVVIFDSARLVERIFGSEGLGAKLINSSAQLVDLRWIALASWRDQIKGVFANPEMTNLLDNNTEISIEALSSSSLSMEALLLAGWFKDRLKLQVVKAFEGGFECRSASGHEYRLCLKTSLGKPGISGITFAFSGESAKSSPYVILKRGALLETLVNEGSGFRTSAPFEEEGTFDLLKHYFTVGASLVNYRSSVRAALKLFTKMIR